MGQAGASWVAKSMLCPMHGERVSIGITFALIPVILQFMFSEKYVLITRVKETQHPLLNKIIDKSFKKFGNIF